MPTTHREITSHRDRMAPLTLRGPEFFQSKLHMLPGVNVPLRSMLVHAGAERILISPVGTDEEAARVGSRLTLVAPDLLHHLHFAEATERYRPVERWGPPGFTDKLPDLGPVKTFGVDEWPHHEHLDYVVLEGAPKKNEVIFYHPGSRTLYAADLFFNIDHPDGFLTPLTFRLMGVHKRFASPRIMSRWVTEGDDFRRSLRKMLAWDFRRVAVGHGAIVDHDARRLVEHALHERGFI